VEPRLLKLALFNVFQNALDAFKRREGSETAVLDVTLQFDAGTETYQILIEDNGPGLRDSSGRLLSAGEAQRVLEYGFTTKGETGEGLGLSWVRTIMAEFHDGGVRAENRTDGPGARLFLWLKSMERSEAKVQQ
jgi:nitrogen fixation/metabolism regulation signal transduction histidine kinase